MQCMHAKSLYYLILEIQTDKQEKRGKLMIIGCWKSIGYLSETSFSKITICTVKHHGRKIFFEQKRNIVFMHDERVLSLKVNYLIYMYFHDCPWHLWEFFILITLVKLEKKSFEKKNQSIIKNTSLRNRRILQRVWYQ